MHDIQTDARAPRARHRVGRQDSGGGNRVAVRPPSFDDSSPPRIDWTIVSMRSGTGRRTRNGTRSWHAPTSAPGGPDRLSASIANLDPSLHRPIGECRYRADVGRESQRLETATQPGRPQISARE